VKSKKIRYLGKIAATSLGLFVTIFFINEWVDYFQDVDSYDRGEFIGFAIFIGSYCLLLIVLIAIGWLLFLLFQFQLAIWFKARIYAYTVYLVFLWAFYLLVRATFSSDQQFVPENMILASIGLGVVVTSQRLFEGNRQRRQTLIWEKERKQTELKMIKAQINPHFLFNALNMVYSDALKIDANQITDNLEKLTEILRYHLYTSIDRPILLTEELDVLTQYVDFQRRRFAGADKIDILFFESVAENDLQIYPFILISLIENAFKHGISQEKPSLVHIELEMRGKSLHFTVKNTNYPKVGKETSGIGNPQLKKLLSVNYPGYRYDHHIKDGFYQVSLNLELEKHV